MDPATIAMIMGGMQLGTSLLTRGGKPKELEDPYAGQKAKLIGQLEAKSRGENLLAPALYSKNLEQIGGNLNASLAAQPGLSRNLATRNIMGAASGRAMGESGQKAIMGKQEQQEAQNQLANVLGGFSQSEMSRNQYNTGRQEEYAQKGREMIPRAAMAGAETYFTQKSASDAKTNAMDLRTSELAEREKDRELFRNAIAKSPTGGAFQGMDYIPRLSGGQLYG